MTLYINKTATGMVAAILNRPEDPRTRLDLAHWLDEEGKSVDVRLRHPSGQLEFVWNPRKRGGIWQLIFYPLRRDGRLTRGFEVALCDVLGVKCSRHAECRQQSATPPLPGRCRRFTAPHGEPWYCLEHMAEKVRAGRLIDGLSKIRLIGDS